MQLIPNTTELTQSVRIKQTDFHVNHKNTLQFLQMDNALLRMLQLFSEEMWADYICSFSTCSVMLEFG